MGNIVLAQQRDVGAIWLLRSERASWLAELGSDQWSQAGLDQQEFMDRVRASITAGETWIWLDDDGAVLGTIALDQWADAGLWTPQERDQSLIVHRMITAREASGRGIGSALLAHAERVAATRNLPWLRLDAWTNNHALHQYYQEQGFQHIRTITAHGTPSGALFERPVRAHQIDSVLISPNVLLLADWRAGDNTPFVVPGMTSTLQHGLNGWEWNGDPITKAGKVLSALDPTVRYRVACHQFSRIPSHEFDNRIANHIAAINGAVLAEPENDTPIRNSIGREDVKA